jgi:hypothetical protein
LVKKKQTTNKKKTKINKKLKYLFDISVIDFWCKKFEKCKIKIKKIRPTPKSITHKNPIKISQSSNKRNNPKVIK